jgi:hypothetical protein
MGGQYTASAESMSRPSPSESDGGGPKITGEMFVIFHGSRALCAEYSLVLEAQGVQYVVRTGGGRTLDLPGMAVGAGCCFNVDYTAKFFAQRGDCHHGMADIGDAV